MDLNKEFWEDIYASGQLGWDMGHVSPPLKAYIDQLNDKNIKILVPGAGNGHEVVYLFQQGFRNVFVADIAHRPLQNIKSKLPDFPKEQLVEGDFFDFGLKDFDLVLEQTFFCALDPRLREAYAKKMDHILKPNGKLCGLLFDFPLSADGPPFGGSTSEYGELFSPYFKINILERCTNSIEPRQGRELFFIFEKKMTYTMQNKILNHQEIQHKIKRIAYQIYEANVEEEEIVIAGIVGGGLLFAKKISKILQEITEAKIILCTVSMDKSNPVASGVSTSIPEDGYRNKSVVLVDDVLNSGTTLIYGVHHFLRVPLKQLKTAVLVNRNHKKYPVKADYKGISLSTSLQEHVNVEFRAKNDSVYLD